MTNRERVLITLSHKQPDKIPYNIHFTKVAHAKMVKYYNDPDFISKLGNCFTWLRPVINNTRFHEISPNIWEDEFGVLWDRTIDKDVGNVCNRLIHPDNLEEFKFPDPDDYRRYNFFDKAIKGNPDTFFVSSIGFSLFERAWKIGRAHV